MKDLGRGLRGREQTPPIKRFLGLLAATTAAALLLPVAPAAAQQPASITALGWWSRRPGASELPNGGFELALAPNGPMSSAALRFRVDAVQLTTGLLELTESTAYGAEVAAVHACPTADAWKAANPGAWEEAPTPKCGIQSIPFSRRNTGEWSGDVRPLLRVGTVSIVLVPMSSEDTQGAPIPYQLVFESARLIASAPATETQPPASGSPQASSPPASPPEVVAAPRLPPAAVGPAAPPIGIAPRTPDVAIEDETLPASADEPDEEESRPWSRLLFFVPLSLAAGVAAFFARSRLRESGPFEA